jgi:prepilin-type N-terminal cleavage/methylation domain-containing protein
MRSIARKRLRGFTIVEIAIVIVIIGILMAFILQGWGMITASQIADTISIAKDLSGAAQTFKQKYRYLPGDFPVDAANPEIGGAGNVLSANCLIGGANAGNGDGVISLTESACASEELIRAGLIRGDPLASISSRFGAVAIISLDSFSIARQGVGSSDWKSKTIKNVVQFSNLPCDVATEIDRKIDDGNLDMGNVRATVPVCLQATPGTPAGPGGVPPATPATPATGAVALAIPL